LAENHQSRKYTVISLQSKKKLGFIHSAGKRTYGHFYFSYFQIDAVNLLKYRLEWHILPKKNAFTVIY